MYANIFIEKHKSHLVVRKDSSNSCWGEEHFSTGLDSSAPISVFEHEPECATVLFSRSRAGSGQLSAAPYEWRSRPLHTVYMQTRGVLEGEPVPPASFQCLLLLRYYYLSLGKWMDMINLSTDTWLLLVPHPPNPAVKGQSPARHSENTTGKVFPCPWEGDSLYGGGHHYGR